MMNITRLLVACLVAAGAMSDVARAGERAGNTKPRTFQLERKPLECSVRVLHGLPRLPMPRVKTRRGGIEGFDAAEVAATTLPQEMVDRRDITVLLAKKQSGQTLYDWLLIDSNANDRFDEGEAYKLAQGERAVHIERSRGDYQSAWITPIEIIPPPRSNLPPRWVALSLYQRRGSAYFRAVDVTLLTGKVAFGEVEVQIGITRARPGQGSDYRMVPDLRQKDPKAVSYYIASQILFDANGNGRFEPTYFYDMGAENRWFTRLVCVGGTWYEMGLARDGTSVRIQGVAPKLGKLAVPEGTSEISVVGPEFAAKWVKGNDRALVLPAGPYFVFTYRHDQGGVGLYARDLYIEAPFDVRPDKVTEIALGGPLGLAVTSSHRGGRASQLRLQLKMLDQAGRKVASMSSGERRQRPPAPRFKIVDGRGRTVDSGKFEYG